MDVGHGSRSGTVSLYQLALLATHLRRCRGFVTPIQVFDSTRVYDVISPGTTSGKMSQDFRVLVLDAGSY